MPGRSPDTFGEDLRIACATSCARSTSSATSRAPRGTSLSGRLRIGMIPTIAPYLLPRMIEKLARLHPGLDIHVRETLTPKLIKESPKAGSTPRSWRCRCMNRR